jgi:hypothetical protein
MLLSWREKVKVLVKNIQHELEHTILKKKGTMNPEYIYHTQSTHNKNEKEREGDHEWIHRTKKNLMKKVN